MSFVSNFKLTVFELTVPYLYIDILLFNTIFTARIEVRAR